MAGYIGARSVSLSTTVANAQDVTATDTTPEVTIINNTHEDTDGGREGKVIFKGQQSGGEETTLALIQAAHDGSSDDEKGLLSFKTNDGNDSNSPTERWRITSDGHFKAMVNGYGIDFSATEGSGASSSVLDDYEYGTWTPSDNSGNSLSFTVSYAKYVKIGKNVTIHAYITFPSTSSSSGASIAGLPFATEANGYGALIINNSVDTLVAQVGSGGSFFHIKNATNVHKTCAQMSTQFIIFSGSYTVA